MKKKFGVRSAECGVAALVLLLAMMLEAQGAMVFVSRETFETIGTLDAGTPGNLGTVTGTFSKRPVGPRTSAVAAPGWSASIGGASTKHSVTLSGQSATSGFFGAWFYIQKSLDDGVNSARLLWITDALSSGTNITAQLFLKNGVLEMANYNTSNQPAIYTPPVMQWFYLALAWQKGASYTVKAYQKELGGALTQIGTTVIANNFNSSFASANGGTTQVGGAVNIIGRYGLPSLYSMASIGDAAYPSDIIDPVAEPHTWYVNPATGNDTNTGLSSGAAWQTITKLNQESQSCGILPVNTGMGTGDVLVIDGSTTPLDLGSVSLSIQSRGLKVSCVGTEPIKPWKTISGTWALTATATKTYETTDAAASDLTGAVLWENDKWLSHPIGANLAAVLAALESTAGSFYSDGTKLYVHPFGDTNPSSDSKVYTRSRNRGASNAGSSAILVNAPDVWVDELRAKKTCLVRATDSDPYNGYLIQWDTGAGGTNRLSNATLDYFSKHAAGRTTSASNMSVSRENVTYGQGSPYVGFGGQTQDADFVASGTGNVGIYINCRSSVTIGVIGSTSGATGGQPSWIAHGVGASFTDFVFKNCNFAGSLSEDSVTTGYVALFNSKVGGMSIGAKRRVVQLDTGRRGRR